MRTMAKKSTSERITKMLVLPDGESDFAGYENPGIVDKESANQAIAAFKEQGVDVPIDFDHATLDKSAPPNATGWIKSLAYEKGKGLMATVELSDEAETLIREKKVKYVSPVAVFNKETHKITRLHSLALTNKPATKHMPEILEYAASHGLKLDANEYAVAAEYGFSMDEATKTAQSMHDMAYCIEAMARVLKSGGYEIPEDQAAEKTVEMATSFITSVLEGLKDYQQEQEKMAATEKTEGNGDIVVALAESLGLKKDAKAEDMVLAIEKLKAKSASTDEVRALREELTALKAKSEADEKETKDARIKSKIEQACKDNRINRHNAAQLASVEKVYALSEEAGDDLIKSMEPLIPAGRTAGSGYTTTSTGNGREVVIAAATREFTTDPSARMFDSKRDYVDEFLRENKLAKLTDEEATKVA